MEGLAGRTPHGRGPRLVPSTGHRGAAAAADPRVGRAGAASWAPNAIEGLPAELRARRGLAGGRRRAPRGPLPRAAEELDAGPRAARLRGALPAPGDAWRPRKRTHRSPARRRASARPGELVERWVDSLPFEPTGDQRSAFEEIEADLDSGEPMQRLLMGEVGSGKTVVAVYAMLRALEAGFQAALMAPTETLAEQHAVDPRPAARGGGDPVCAADRRDPGAEPQASARPARQRRAGTDRRAPTP